MKCPSCRGQRINTFDDGTFECLTILTPGPGPGHVICSWRFSQEDAERAEAFYHKRELRSQAESQTEADRRAIHNGPATPGLIAELAGTLIDRHPRRSKPLVVEVKIPPRTRRGKPNGKPNGNWKNGYATVDRLWPTGSIEVIGAYHVHRTAETGVNRDGDLMEITTYQPSVKLTAGMKYRYPGRARAPARDQHQAEFLWRAILLDRLQKDVAEPWQESDETPADVTATEPLVGRPLSNRESSKAYELGYTMVRDLEWDLNYIVEHYGTRDAPKTPGPPDDNALESWKRLHKRVAKREQALAKYRELTGKTLERSWLNADTRRALERLVSPTDGRLEHGPD